MVNSAQRYAFDSQASILNARNSGRLTRRIAECMLVNGHYGPARKQLELLSQSLYYADWADEKLQSLKLSGKAREQEIEKDAQLLRVRNLRFKNEFLYNYEEMDKTKLLISELNRKLDGEVLLRASDVKKEKKNGQ